MKFNLQEIIELVKASGRENDPTARNALLGFLCSGNPKSEKLAQLKQKQFVHFTENLKSEAIEEIINPHPFSNYPSPEDLTPGDITIGNVIKRNEIDFRLALPIDIFQEHIGIFGCTGSGKSYLTKFITCQLIEKRIPCWFLDEEDEYKDLGFLFPPEQLIILDYKQFKRNIYEVLPGEHPIETLNRVKDVWRNSLYLRDGSENLLGEVLHEMFLRRGIFDGSKNYPTQFDVAKELSKLRFKANSRNAGYLETLINRSTNICNYLGDIYDCISGFNLQDLMKKSLVIRLRGMNEYCKEFFINDIFKAIHALCDSYTSALKLVLVLDEGHRTFSKAKIFRSDLGEPIAFIMVRSLRKRGVGLIVTDQVPGEIHPAVIGNLGTRIVFRLLDGRCIRAIGESMSLEPEQKSYITELPRRVAVIQPGHYPVPFLVKVPELFFQTDISEEELKVRLETVRNELAWTPRQEQAAAAEVKMPAPYPGPACRASEEKGDKEKAIKAAISKQAIDYLIDIANKPFIPSTKRDAALGLSAWKGNEIRAELGRAGLVNSVKINTGTRGGVILLLEVTEKGYEFLNGLKAGVARPRGKGGFEHKFWAWHCAAWFEKEGYKTYIEDSRFGKCVDIGLEKEGRLLGVEIMVKGQIKELSNITKDIEASYGEIIICCHSEREIKKLKEAVIRNLGEDVAAKVSYRILSSFLE